MFDSSYIDKALASANSFITSSGVNAVQEEFDRAAFDNALNQQKVEYETSYKEALSQLDARTAIQIDFKDIAVHYSEKGTEVHLPSSSERFLPNVSPIVVENQFLGKSNAVEQAFAQTDSLNIEGTETGYAVDLSNPLSFISSEIARFSIDILMSTLNLSPSEMPAVMKRMTSEGRVDSERAAAAIELKLSQDGAQAMIENGDGTGFISALTDIIAPAHDHVNEEIYQAAQLIADEALIVPGDSIRDELPGGADLIDPAELGIRSLLNVW